MKTDRTQLHRAPSRGSYDPETLYQILDKGYLCHIAIVHNDAPVCIPTLYGRDGNKLYFHGSIASRLMKNMKAGLEVCITVTHVDGLVLARSAFHHSMNYQSAVIMGTATALETETEKNHALKVISDQILPNRWEEVREPSANELKATEVLQLTLAEASCKIRKGPPIDDDVDYQLPIWAGVLPIETRYGNPIADDKLSKDIPLSESVQNVINSSND